MFTKSFNAIRELGGKNQPEYKIFGRKKPSGNRYMTTSHCSNSGQLSGSIVRRVPLTAVSLTRTCPGSGVPQRSLYLTSLTK